MSLQQERISAEMANTSLQEKIHNNDVLRQELEKTKAERADATANLATYTDRLQSLQGDKEDLQVNAQAHLVSVLCLPSYSNTLLRKNKSFARPSKLFPTSNLNGGRFVRRYVTPSRYDSTHTNRR